MERGERREGTAKRDGGGRAPTALEISSNHSAVWPRVKMTSQRHARRSADRHQWTVRRMSSSFPSRWELIHWAALCYYKPESLFGELLWRKISQVAHLKGVIHSCSLQRFELKSVHRDGDVNRRRRWAWRQSSQATPAIGCSICLKEKGGQLPCPSHPQYSLMQIPVHTQALWHLVKVIHSEATRKTALCSVPVLRKCYCLLVYLCQILPPELRFCQQLNEDSI